MYKVKFRDKEAAWYVRHRLYVGCRVTDSDRPFVKARGSTVIVDEKDLSVLEKIADRIGAQYKVSENS